MFVVGVVILGLITARPAAAAGGWVEMYSFAHLAQ